MYGYRGDRRTLRSSGCLDASEENVKVGTHVTLIADREAFQKSFDAVPYIWDDAMVSLLGQKVTVVSRVEPGIFGLTKSDPRSNQAVWYYPFSVITCVEDKATTGRQRISTTTTTTTETDNESYYSDYPDYYKKYNIEKNRHYLNSYTTKYRYPQQYATTSPYLYVDHYPRHYVNHYRYAYYHSDYHSSYDPTEQTCRDLAWFEAPALVLMICLAITTAVSACLLRAIEKEMPQIEPLPAGKMVVLACPDTVEVPPAPTTEVVRATEVALAPPTEVDRVAMGEGNSTTDMKTEQNV